MIFNVVLNLLETKAERLAAAWCHEINKSSFMHTYRQLPEDELVKRHTRVVENLGHWLERESSRNDVGRFFAAMGRDRYREGFPLCEVNYALFLAKKGFWELIHSEGILDSALELYQALELITNIHSFFDLGNFYLIRGYMEEMYGEMQTRPEVSKADLKRFFFPGSFLQEDFPIPGKR
jgi:hypothetical protein